MADILNPDYWHWVWAECDRRGPECWSQAFGVPGLDGQQHALRLIFSWCNPGTLDSGGLREHVPVSDVLDLPGDGNGGLVEW